MAGECRLVTRVEPEGGDRVQAVGCGNLICRSFPGVGELHPVTDTFGQKPRDQCADLAGAEDQNVLHRIPLIIVLPPDPRRRRKARIVPMYYWAFQGRS